MDTKGTHTTGPAPTTFEPVDVLVVGAGPIGLACALEAQRAGLTARVIEKGALVNSLVGYPVGMEFFSTPELLEIGGHPLPTARYKPTREDALDYYRGVAASEKLDVRLYERVVGLEGDDGAFRVVTSKGVHPCRKVVVATGFYDEPVRLDVPGEELPHVAHYYREPYAFTGQRVAVVGAKNSAAKAALDLHRHGAKVTMVVRGPAISEKVKYWIRPDIENRIKEGSIRAFLLSTVARIEPGALHLSTPDGPVTIEADWVLALTGYRPDFEFLQSFGIEFVGERLWPVQDAETMETNRAGVYLAGTVCGGLDTSRWFIENGRIHAARIAAHVAGRPVPALAAHGQP